MKCSWGTCEACVKIEAHGDGTSCVFCCGEHNHSFVEQPYQCERKGKMSTPLKAIVAAAVVPGGRPSSQDQTIQIVESFAKSRQGELLIGGGSPVTGGIVLYS